jgi:hypothetical protein
MCATAWTYPVSATTWPKCWWPGVTASAATKSPEVCVLEEKKSEKFKTLFNKKIKMKNVKK